jgi:hypothetical protein
MYYNCLNACIWSCRGGPVDDYMHMSGSTCLDVMYKFCKAVVQVSRGEFSREPNVTDISWMLGGIDAYTLRVKELSITWQTEYKGYAGGCTCTIILECWGCCITRFLNLTFFSAWRNDMNSCFNALRDSLGLWQFFTKMHYPSNGIYQLWSILVKIFFNPPKEKRCIFVEKN